MQTKVKKKAALITGGAQRIGAFIAKELAKAGYDIAIHYNKSEEEAHKTKSFIEDNFFVKAICIQQDLLKDQNYNQTIRFAAKTFPHLCLLVNNASLFLSDNLEDAEFKRFDNHYKIHVLAPFFLIQSFLTIPNKNLCIISILDDLVYSKTAKKYFSYTLSKKSADIMLKMIEELIKNDKKNVILRSIFPKKILEPGVQNSDKLIWIKNQISKILADL